MVDDAAAARRVPCTLYATVESREEAVAEGVGTADSVARMSSNSDRRVVADRGRREESAKTAAVGTVVMRRESSPRTAIVATLGTRGAVTQQTDT